MRNKLEMYFMYKNINGKDIKNICTYYKELKQTKLLFIAKVIFKLFIIY